jgi:xanthine dehydrogenase YagS FAD-binding subunit
VNPLRYAVADDATSASTAVLTAPAAAFIAGGTNIVDLMKDDVYRPPLLVNITGLPMKSLTTSADGGLLVGALATMADVADAARVRDGFPVISEALLLSASPQLRNMATIGGNVLQRTRCAYFRDASQACNKREPGRGCAAIGGENRYHAVIGTSDHCICSHPSDLAVALLTVDAVVHTTSPAGRRAIPLAQLHVLPGNRPDIETVLHPGELIEAIELPPSPRAKASAYIKVRDRASYQFALVSAAVALEANAGTIRSARVAIGSVAPVPWRAYDVEAALAGQPLSDATFARAATIATRGMRGHGENDYKIPLTEKTVLRALQTAGERA